MEKAEDGAEGDTKQPDSQGFLAALKQTNKSLPTCGATGMSSRCEWACERKWGGEEEGGGGERVVEGKGGKGTHDTATKWKKTVTHSISVDW